MKKVLFSLLLLFLLTGCFNYNELNEYAIVTNMAIDYRKNNYFVTLLVSNDNENKNIFYTGKGKTVYEAIKDIDFIAPKKIYMGHLSTVIISEESAKKGLYKSLEIFLDNPQLSKNFYIALAKNSSAEKILKANTPLANYPSQYIMKNIESSKNIKGSTVATDFNSLLQQLIGENENPTINGFSIVQDSSTQYLKLNTLGYFKNDKLIGWANEEESKGINIINNRINSMYLNLKCQKGNILVYVQNLKTSISISKNKILIKTKGNSNIKESTCIKNKKKIEKDINQELANYMQKAFQLSIKNKIDLFAVKRLYYQNGPYKYTNKGDNYYKNDKIIIKTKIKLHNIHSSQNHLERIDHEKNY